MSSGPAIPRRALQSTSSHSEKRHRLAPPALVQPLSHCLPRSVEYDTEELAHLAPVDAVITPVSGQALPGFELVHGPSASVDLVKRLQPRWVLPMQNGAVDMKGLSAPLITEIGSRADFEGMLRSEGMQCEVLDVQPGKTILLEKN